jgi:hypothetical protein
VALSVNGAFYGRLRAGPFRANAAYIVDRSVGEGDETLYHRKQSNDIDGVNKTNGGHNTMKNRICTVAIVKPAKQKGVSAASRVSAARVASGTPDVALRAQITGNAAGIHGGTRLRYGKRDRQAVRREERTMSLSED